MITLSDKEQILLQAAMMNLSADLAAAIDFEKVASITGHANKSVARTMFKRMMDKIKSGDQPPNKTSTPSKSRKRKVDDMVDKDDEENAKGTKQSRSKAQPVAKEELDEEFSDPKTKIKRERQPDALEGE